MDKIPHRGCVLDTSSARIKDKTKAALYLGLYERAEIDQTRAFVMDNFDVIELGSSIGANSTQILQKMGKNKKLIAVEVDPELCEIIKKNIDKLQSRFPEGKFSKEQAENRRDK